MGLIEILNAEFVSLDPSMIDEDELNILQATISFFVEETKKRIVERLDKDIPGTSIADTRDNIVKILNEELG